MITLYAKAFSFKPSASLDLMLGLPKLPRSKNIVIQAKHCQTYNNLVDWCPDLVALVHPNYIQTLSLPMQLDMMVDKAFPFKPLGLVHLANEITCEKLPEHDSEINIRTEFGNLYKHKKGWLFEVITSASDIKHTRSQVFSATSYYLARMKHRLEDELLSAKESEQIPGWIDQIMHEVQQGTEQDIMSEPLYFSSNIGRKYAKVSGDYNPIHLHAMTAKVLGFKKAIAHGMYSKALAVSKMAQKNHFYKRPFRIDTVFMQPIVLPLETDFCMFKNDEHYWDKGEGTGFYLRSKARRKSRVHLFGNLHQR